MSQFILTKDPFYPEFKQTASRATSTRAEPITPERSAVQQDLQRAASHMEKLGSSINNVHGLSLQGQTNELVDHRLLTGKLGGWGSLATPGHRRGYGPSISGESTQQTHYQGERKAARQRVYLHAAPRTLPSYLIKLINQLMRHGKKGISVGLIADSLTLFLKKLEEGGRINSHNDILKNAVLSKQVGGQSEIALKKGMIQPKGVPSFPFYSASFPGVTFGDMFSTGNRQLNILLSSPFSGTRFPDFYKIRALFKEKGGNYRGSLGFERVHNLDAAKNQSFPFLCDTPPFTYAPAFWAGSRNRRLINLETLTLGKKPNPTTTLNLSKVEVGIRSHTQKPIYFWHMKTAGRPCLPIEVSTALPLHFNSSKQVKVLGFDGHLRPSKGGLSPAQSRFITSQGIPPQASLLDSLSRAIANVEPSLEVRKKKIAGITRQIPCVVSKSRGERLAIRWIINSARERVKKRGKGLPYCLAEELIDAYYKRGEPRQKRDSLHKAAESNRSFLRYRWW